MRAAMWWIDRWRQSDAFARMTAEEQGLYRNLCDEVVLRADGVIPDEPRILAKASGDHEAWDRSGKSVLKSMKKVSGGWTNETAMSVRLESERRSKKQAEYRAKRNKSGNEAGNDSGNDGMNEPDNETVPPEQEQDKYQERKKEKEPNVDPGRVVKAESTATPDGTPVKLSDVFEPTATAPRRLTPKALGIRVDPANFAQVQLSHDLAALVEVVRRNYARFADPEKFDPVCEALGLLHDISATPAGKRIETLDLRRVSRDWSAISSHAAYKLAREVYGVELDPATARATDTPVAASGSGGEGASASGRSPSLESPKKPLPALTLTVAPGACPVCSSPLRHSTEGGEIVLRCDQETVPCEWAAVWRSCAA